MKERIKELADVVCNKSNLPTSGIVYLHAVDALTTLYNEAMEKAASECETNLDSNGMVSDEWNGSKIHTIRVCADAIRKLKV